MVGLSQSVTLAARRCEGKSLAGFVSPLMVLSNHRDVYGQCRLLNAKLRALATLLQRSDFSGA